MLVMILISHKLLMRLPFRWRGTIMHGEVGTAAPLPSYVAAVSWRRRLSPRRKGGGHTGVRYMCFAPTFLIFPLIRN